MERKPRTSRMSLRSRILGGIGLIAVVLVIVTLAITRITYTNMIAQVDRQLSAAMGTVRGFGNVTDPDRSPIGIPGPGMPQPPFGANDPDKPQPGSTGAVPDRLSSLYVGRVDDDEVETIFMPNLFDDDVDDDDQHLSLTAQQATESARTNKPFMVASQSGERYRMIAYTDMRTGVVVVLGSGLQSVDSTINNLILIQAIGAAVIIGALILLAWWVIRLGVRPIRTMTTVASAIAAGDLSQRVPDASPGTEAGDLGEALNQMLTQIDMTLAERARVEELLRQFVADASHELRTPVATIRGYAELYRSGGLRESEALTDAMSRTEAEAIRMGDLVEELLELARLDQGRPLDLTEVDLGVLVREAAADLAVLDPDRPVTVVAEEPVIAICDGSRIRQVITNLVSNVQVHTPPGTAIDLVARIDGSDTVVSVTDHGPGMDAETARHVFERFYRADVSRTRRASSPGTGGTGLGLAIVEALVTAHHGSVELDSEPGRGTTVTVRLPVGRV